MFDLIESDMATRPSGKVGDRISRSEIVTVRLDPKLRYLANLAARKQRRTVSSFIEWAIEHGLDSVSLSASAEGPTTWQEADSLWDVDEADRFVKLAVGHPELLTHEEQVLWKVIREFGWVWKGKYNAEGNWIWTPSSQTVRLNEIRACWETFKAIASGDAGAKSKLPKWIAHKDPDQKTTEKKKGKFDDMEDDIPF